MRKHIDTVYDYFKSASTGELLRAIATMLARRDQEYRESYIEKTLQDQIALEMLHSAMMDPANQHVVTVQFASVGAVVNKVYRGPKVKSITDGIDEMSIEDYTKEVIEPDSTDLARSLLWKVLPGPVPMEFDIEVRRA